MTKRIDVSKLRGTYYNNERESYAGDASYADVQKSLSTDFESLQDNTIDFDFDDIENMIVAHIRTMPIHTCNNVLNDNSEELDEVEIHTNLANIYMKFHDIASFSTVFLVYCDYFGLKYDKVIKSMPNGLKDVLYNELKRFTRNTDNLSKLFKIYIDDDSHKLF